VGSTGDQRSSAAAPSHSARALVISVRYVLETANFSSHASTTALTRRPLGNSCVYSRVAVSKAGGAWSSSPTTQNTTIPTFTALGVKNMNRARSAASHRGFRPCRGLAGELSSKGRAGRERDRRRVARHGRVKGGDRWQLFHRRASSGDPNARASPPLQDTAHFRGD